MNPYDEQRLRDEVIYLHYLWHQGPPQQSSSSSQPLLHRNPFPPSHTRSLPPIASTAFKKRNSINKNRKNRKEPKPASPKWCPNSPHSPQTGWNVPNPRSEPPPPPPPPPPLQPQEKERLSALQVQNNACKAFREFLSGSNDGSDDEEDDGRLEEFEEFFIRVFMEDNELTGYYQRCFENGEFICLVCGASEKKSGKKFKDCIGLVQHSTLILRTANKMAHRAFGQAVCKVLGWDIHRLPTIVITAEPVLCSKEINTPQLEPQTGWPVPKPISDPPLQPQEKERLSALQAQNKVCKAFRKLLSGSDDEDDDEEDEDGSDGRLEEFENFFIRVFMEDNELMGYYQRCFENGEFFCLVCSASEKKSGKKFKDCIGLVQHSTSILRTANKMAHRAFGQAVCKVLGWDICRLPTIVITAEPLRCSKEIIPPQLESVADDDGKDGSRKTEDIAVSLEHVEEHVKGADQSIGECSSKEGDIGLENGEGGAKFEGDIKEKAVSLAHDDEPVEDHDRGVDQSINKVINL